MRALQLLIEQDCLEEWPGNLLWFLVRSSRFFLRSSFDCTQARRWHGPTAQHGPRCSTNAMRIVTNVSFRLIDRLMGQSGRGRAGQD
ncbi:MAG: hypothetical protein KDK27_15105, partial [Leptospiraceae bacterium]|nr:hypothetical protein [Leptospiraceae bacterium]